jgi:hypothetical protein
MAGDGLKLEIYHMHPIPTQEEDMPFGSVPKYLVGIILDVIIPSS